MPPTLRQERLLRSCTRPTDSPAKPPWSSIQQPRWCAGPVDHSVPLHDQRSNQSGAMGFRFRKTVRVAPGIRLNLSKSGTSLSIGGRGATVNVRGKRVRTTLGIPGTGVSYVSSTTLGASRRHPAAAAPRQQGSVGLPQNGTTTGGHKLLAAAAVALGILVGIGSGWSPGLMVICAAIAVAVWWIRRP